MVGRGGGGGRTTHNGREGGWSEGRSEREARARARAKAKAGQESGLPSQVTKQTGCDLVSLGRTGYRKWLTRGRLGRTGKGWGTQVAHQRQTLLDFFQALVLQLRRLHQLESYLLSTTTGQRVLASPGSHSIRTHPHCSHRAFLGQVLRTDTTNYACRLLCTHSRSATQTRAAALTYPSLPSLSSLPSLPSLHPHTEPSRTPACLSSATLQLAALNSALALWVLPCRHRKESS